MAAPTDVTLKDLSGVWVMNKTLSDDIDPILVLQGISWLMRRAISYATITLTITSYVDSSSLTHIDISQVATGGIKGSTELRTLDWTERTHKDGIFGEVKGKTRWTKLEDVDDDKWLKEGWVAESGGKWVQSWAESVGGGWTADQIWGFEKIDGKRYHVRHVVVRKGDDWKQARLVYDFVKKLDKKEEL